MTGLALLGGGIFARSQYLPLLSKLAEKVSLKAIWSRSQESAEAAVLLAKDSFPSVVAKWGPEGLDEILSDDAIHGVLIVLAAQIQLEYVLKALEHGKNVLQEKPVGANVAETRKAISFYNSMDVGRPIWAVAENYRFETGLVEASKHVKNIGEMTAVQVIVELPMNSSNPYYLSSWRKDIQGGFVLDGGVHFIAGLRLITGCEVRHVSGIARQVDPSLPSPDNVSAIFQLDNGCGGVFLISYSCTERQVCWRVLGSKGTVQVERSMQTGTHGYMVSYFPVNGSVLRNFFPFCGVEQELAAFLEDVSKIVFEGANASKADKRSLVDEAFRDLAVVEAVLKSSSNKCSFTAVDTLDEV